MRTISRSALVPYTAEQMFALVDDVESYPQFLPWCRSTVVHYRDATTVEATLELSHGAFNKKFRTRNSSVPGEFMTIALIGGPFRRLDGGWNFTKLGDAGSKVALDLEFEFSSKAVDLMFGRFFEDACNTLVDAFTRRAEEIYGTARQ